ncbi:MAG TPA: hypothetical protein VMW85_08115 [Methanomassiliicoccales archaeon]|nr:hypothetical protein [Methanomassiliicoccales archaeon]
MRIELLHASKYGNGEKVAAYLQGLLVAKGHQANVHHVKQIKPKDAPAADLYVFCSPARIGKPIGAMRRFLKKVTLPQEAKYGLIATLGQPKPDKKTGEMPSPEQTEKYQRSLPIMEGLLTEKGAVKIAEIKVFVVDIKGPLEEGWEKKMMTFASQLG